MVLGTLTNHQHMSSSMGRHTRQMWEGGLAVDRIRRAIHDIKCRLHVFLCLCDVEDSTHLLIEVWHASGGACTPRERDGRPTECGCNPKRSQVRAYRYLPGRGLFAASCCLKGHWVRVPNQQLGLYFQPPTSRG